MAAGRGGGFILVYVAALLAAIGVVLFELGRMQSPSPRFIERQIAGALQRSEQRMVLDFVIAGTRDQKLALDPRYLQFQRILALAPRPPSELDDQIAWLKAALAGLGIRVTDRAAQAAATAEQTAQAGAGGLEGSQPQILFAPRKTPYAFKIGNTEYQITVHPGNAFPNLNGIPLEALARTLSLLKLPEREVMELAAALVDWRDADEFRSAGIGAESDYYSSRSPPYAPRNAPIRSWQELNYVRGMTPERVAMLREHFILGPAEMAGLHIDFAGADAFAAMTGIAPERVVELLKAYGKLEDAGTPVGTILFTHDATEFEKAAVWSADTSVLRIRIRSADSVLTADYDTRNRRLIAMW